MIETAAFILLECGYVTTFAKKIIEKARRISDYIIQDLAKKIEAVLPQASVEPIGEVADPEVISVGEQVAVEV